MTVDSRSRIALQVRSLGRSVGLRTLFEHVSFELSAGSCLAVLGPNGAGKTSLLRTLALVAAPTWGEIHMHGRPVAGRETAARAEIGFLAHQPFIDGRLSGLENLRFYSRLYDLRLAEVELRRALDEVGLRLFADDPARTYSRGMLQRLALARATLHRPRLWLLDEPHTGLDRQAAELLDRRMAEHRQSGGAIVLVSHDLERVTRLADWAIILRAGRSVWQGVLEGVAPEELAALYARAVGGAEGQTADASAPEGGSAPAGGEPT